MDWKQVLLNAGLPCESAGVNQFGKVDASFTRPLTPTEWLLFLQLTDVIAYRKANARAEAKLATELKSLTPAQAVAYIETNVTNLASAKTVLKIMARILIAMRDEIWPELPDQ
jgi:hypothetical protein